MNEIGNRAGSVLRAVLDRRRAETARVPARAVRRRYDVDARRFVAAVTAEADPSASTVAEPTADRFEASIRNAARRNVLRAAGGNGAIFRNAGRRQGGPDEFDAVRAFLPARPRRQHCRSGDPADWR